MPAHVPVMTAEVLAALHPERGGVFVDCTVGLGGHARALLEAGATRLIGIDRDPAALALAGEALAEWGSRVELVHGDYRDAPRLLDERGIEAIDGAVADLGVSSLQLDGEGRGFSFQRDEPLDMRMDTSQGPTAADLIADVSERDLADVIYRYGEERRSRAVARAIVAARRVAPIDTTAQLASIVRRVVRPQRPHRPGHADVPGDPHLGERRTGWARRLPARGLFAAPGRRPVRGGDVPLARGQAREAHLPGAGGRAGDLPSADEEVGGPGRRGNPLEPACAQRAASGH